MLSIPGENKKDFENKISKFSLLNLSPAVSATYLVTLSYYFKNKSPPNEGFLSLEKKFSRRCGSVDKTQAHTMSIGVHAELKVSDKSRKQDTLYRAERYLLHRGTSAALVIAHTPRQRSSALQQQQQQLPSLSQRLEWPERVSSAPGLYRLGRSIAHASWVCDTTCIGRARFRPCSRLVTFETFFSRDPGWPCSIQ